MLLFDHHLPIFKMKHTFSNGGIVLVECIVTFSKTSYTNTLPTLGIVKLYYTHGIAHPCGALATDPTATVVDSVENVCKREGICNEDVRNPH